MKLRKNRDVRPARLSPRAARGSLAILCLATLASACGDVGDERVPEVVQLAEVTCATELDCRSEDPCIVASCEAGECVFEDRAELADLAVPCAEHACADGRVLAVVLDDQSCDAALVDEPCRTGICTPSGCDTIITPNGAVCTTDSFVGTCEFGACVPEPECRTNSQCDDGNPCTLDECRVGVCVAAGVVDSIRRCDSGMLGDEDAIHRTCARSGEFAGLCVVLEG